MNKCKNFAQEVKRQELIKELAACAWHGLSDGRILQELSLQELQQIQKGERKNDQEKRFISL